MVRTCVHAPTQWLVFLASFISPLGWCVGVFSLCTLAAMFPLLQWLRSIETSREQFGIVKGNCPYCSHVRISLLYLSKVYVYVCLCCVLRGEGRIEGCGRCLPIGVVMWLRHSQIAGAILLIRNTLLFLCGHVTSSLTGTHLHLTFLFVGAWAVSKWCLTVSKCFLEAQVTGYCCGVASVVSRATFSTDSITTIYNF